MWQNNNNNVKTESENRLDDIWIYRKKMWYFIACYSSCFNGRKESQSNSWNMWLVIPPYQRIVNYQSLDVALYMQRLLTTPIISFRKKLIFLEQIPSRYYSRYRKYLEPPPRIRNQLMVRTIDIALIVYIVLLAHTDPLFCYRYLIVNVYRPQISPWRIFLR